MRDRARHLDRVVRFGRRDVGLLDFDKAVVSECSIHVALLDLDVLVVIRLRFFGLMFRRFHAEKWFLRRVIYFYQRCSVTRLL